MDYKGLYKRKGLSQNDLMNKMNEYFEEKGSFVKMKKATLNNTIRGERDFTEIELEAFYEVVGHNPNEKSIKTQNIVKEPNGSYSSSLIESQQGTIHMLTKIAHERVANDKDSEIHAQLLGMVTSSHDKIVALYEIESLIEDFITIQEKITNFKNRIISAQGNIISFAF